LNFVGVAVGSAGIRYSGRLQVRCGGLG